MRDGQPTGDYEDFLTGFVVDNTKVWGRPVGVATARDGSLACQRRCQRHGLAHRRDR